MPETASDKILDEIVGIVRATKDPTWQGQVKALWKIFNIMVGFIKGQQNLINAMDKEIKKQRVELDRLKGTVSQILGGMKGHPKSLDVN